MIMRLGKIRDNEKLLHGVRLIMWEIRSKYLKKGKSIEPKDVFKLPGDEPDKPKLMTKEEFLQYSAKN